MATSTRDEQPNGILPYGKPIAHVERDFFRDGVRIHLAIRGRTSLWVLSHDGTIREFGSDEVGTDAMESPCLSIPESLARVLFDALATHFGGMPETMTNRQDLLHERGRVDKLLDVVTRIAEGVRQ